MALEAGAIIADKSEADRLVAVPGMNAICKHLATDVETHFKSRVTPPRRAQDRWQLTSDDGSDLGYFDAVLVSAPASQAADLLRAVPHLADQAGRTEMSGCWAVMIAPAKPTGARFDAAFVRNSPLSWIARNSSNQGSGRSLPWPRS